jgi:uncharacterized protein (UPF0335 family)
MVEKSKYRLEREAIRAAIAAEDFPGIAPWPTLTRRSTQVPIDFLANQMHSPYTIEYFLNKINELEERIKEMEEKTQEDIFDFKSDDFDGLKALRYMNREADEAINKTSVVLEDTRRFIEARQKKPSP